MKVLTAMAFFAALAVSGAASAQEMLTVQSLLNQQFNVVAAMTSQIGPGLFLQRGNQLFLCFVSETPESKAVNTRYCKRVR